MKIICIGRNYSDHINELGNTRPSNPVVFLKPDSSIIAKNQNFIIPAFSNEIHHEVELVIKINKVGKHIDQSFANKYYNEIGLGIDFTARDIQNNLKEKGHPWEKSKAFDNSCLVGEFINKDKFDDLSKSRAITSRSGRSGTRPLCCRWCPSSIADRRPSDEAVRYSSSSLC